MGANHPTTPHRHNTTSGYLDVNNNLHQIPIGTMRYTAVNHLVLRAWAARRQKFQLS
jgi:hypothetical protein